MTKEEILQWLDAHKVFYLATTEGNKPHVRGLMLHKANENGIYFTTTKVRDLYKQLVANPEVELCFHEDKMQIRVSGRIEERDDDIELKKEIAAARPFMKPWLDRTGFGPMAVFRVVDCVATVWTMETTLAPKTYMPLT